MILLIIFLICVFITLAIGGLAALSDLKSMKIPNAYSLVVVGVFFVAYAATYFGGFEGKVFGFALSHLLSAGATFILTLILFALGMIGGGDAKFASACAFWIQAKYIPVYLFFMTLLGGLLGLVALYLKKKKPFKAPVEGSWAAQVQGGADKVPYGVAISFGMLIAFIHSGYFSTDVLSIFLAVQVEGSGS